MGRVTSTSAQRGLVDEAGATQLGGRIGDRPIAAARVEIDADEPLSTPGEN